MVKLDGFAKLMNFKLRRKTVAINSSLETKQSIQNKDATRLFDNLHTLIHKILNARASASSDLALSQFSNEYYKLELTNRYRALKLLATGYGVDRTNIQSLAQQYLGAWGCENLKLVNDGNSLSVIMLGKIEKDDKQDENIPALYRTEQSLRSALTPKSAQLFKQFNCQPGGLKFLVDLRADLRALIEEQNVPVCRHLDACLKEILETALTPAGLELHLFTWDDPASILEKIVIFEAVHPISNLFDLKRRLGPGRRCFGYFHPLLPGEPLNFIEVALTRSILGSIQDVLRNEAPTPEDTATTALFYSISSTQLLFPVWILTILGMLEPGLAGISLGKLLIKRVVSVLQQEMPKIEAFATLSPIPGFMAWLLPKLASQAHSVSSSTTQVQGAGHTSLFNEDMLYEWEERSLLESCGNMNAEKQRAELVLWRILTSPGQEWIRSESLQKAIKPILLRLCARYLLKEKRRGKALDTVTNFHVQNGAVVEKLNWMGDCSERGLIQSAGIMVNYVYRLGKIEDNIEQYVEKGVISSSSDVIGLLTLDVYLKSPVNSQQD